MKVVLKQKNEIILTSNNSETTEVCEDNINSRRDSYYDDYNRNFFYCEHNSNILHLLQKDNLEYNK